MKIEQLFFELIQVSLGQRKYLNRIPTEEEWQALFDMAWRQTMMGVLYHGLELLSAQRQKPPRKLLLKWYSASQKIEQRSVVFDKRCKELQGMLSDSSIRSSILKGQGLAQYYGDLRSMRQSSDIDIYVDCGRERAIEFAREHGENDIVWSYKHLDLNIWSDVKIEVHYHVCVLYNPFRDRRLQSWFSRNQEMLFSRQSDIVTPSAPMNLFYVLLHMYNHFLSTGITMRHLVDYYYVVSSTDPTTVRYNDGESLEDVLRTYGLLRFAGGVLWALQETVGLEQTYMYCQPLEREGRLILDELLSFGSFSRYDMQQKIKKPGRVSEFVSISRRNLRVLRMFPSDALWAPAWFIGHKLWMLKNIWKEKLSRR